MDQNVDLNALIDRKNLGLKDQSSDEERGLFDAVAALLSGRAKPEEPKSEPPSPRRISPVDKGATSKVQKFLPIFMELTQLLLKEILERPQLLLTLNRSRRDDLIEYLETLAEIPPRPKSLGVLDSAVTLKRWLEGPRSDAQNVALCVFFEELALAYLSKAVLLKAWSDRGIRPWSPKDLKDIVYTLNQALKPFQARDRENWKICSNLYSWYNPTPSAVEKIWNCLQEIHILPEEGDTIITALFRMGRMTQPKRQDRPGYDLRFSSALWSEMHTFGLSLEEPKETGFRFDRKRFAYSATLRDGATIRTGPSHFQWIGFESSPLQLMIAELTRLWNGPLEPPLWEIGDSLEAHPRDQPNLFHSSLKPTTLSHIINHEACDVSFVFEEETLRATDKTPCGLRFKNEIESIGFYSSVRGQSVSLGALQACVALRKLRPQGLFFWARKEPLTPIESKTVLKFLWDYGQLLCEWDFSKVEHSLPSPYPLLPHFLYLFKREPSLEKRSSHRPIRIQVAGALRSHVELPQLLSDALSSFSTLGQPRGQWSLTRQESNSQQQDWLEHWPSGVDAHKANAWDQLRPLTTPLVQIAQTNSRSTLGKKRHEPFVSNDDLFQKEESLLGLWVTQTQSTEGVKAKSLSVEIISLNRLPKGKQGFLLTLPGPQWATPLAAYLKSHLVWEWLEFHAEKKGAQWVLKEQNIKHIPIPNLLIEALRSDQEISLVHDEELDPSKNIFNCPIWIKKLIFESHQFAQTIEKNKSLFRSINERAEIRWRELLELLAPAERLTFNSHPQIKIQGELLQHVPITKIEKSQGKHLHITLSTENGMMAKIFSNDPLLLEILWNQLDTLDHPTWAELYQNIILPRNSSIARDTANELLKLYAEHQNQLNQAREMLEKCLKFNHSGVA